MRKVAYVLWVFVLIIMSFVGYNEYMRNKRMHQPCVVFHQGMTLLPGQCATTWFPKDVGKEGTMTH